MQKRVVTIDTADIDALEFTVQHAELPEPLIFDPVDVLERMSEEANADGTDTFRVFRRLIGDTEHKIPGNVLMEILKQVSVTVMTEMDSLKKDMPSFPEPVDSIT